MDKRIGQLLIIVSIKYKLKCSTPVSGVFQFAPQLPTVALLEVQLPYRFINRRSPSFIDDTIDRWFGECAFMVPYLLNRC